MWGMSFEQGKSIVKLKAEMWLMCLGTQADHHGHKGDSKVNYWKKEMLLAWGVLRGA